LEAGDQAQQSHERSGAPEYGDCPVVLLPGLLTTPQIWETAQNVLAQDGWASHAAMCPALETVEAIADQLATSLPERCHLVGFSFGGYVALAIQDLYPERVASLCLVGSGGHCDNKALRVFRQQCIDEVCAGNFPAVSAKLAEAALMSNPFRTSGLAEQAVTMAHDYGADRFVAHLRACMTRPDRTRVLETAEISLHFISGAQDLTVPLALQQRSAEAGGGMLHLIDKAAHLVPLEQPQALSELLVSCLKQTGRISMRAAHIAPAMDLDAASTREADSERQTS